MSKELTIYSDIDLNFYPHPLTEDVNPITNYKAIQQSIKNLVMFNPFDFPFERRFGKGINAYLFGSGSHLEAADLQTYLEWLIRRYERRVNLVDISVIYEEETASYTITITYKVKATNGTDTITFNFQRIR